eukprot:scaffold31794_cov107-Isochrysis_galbana.AAC.2
MVVSRGRAAARARRVSHTASEARGLPHALILRERTARADGARVGRATPAEGHSRDCCDRPARREPNCWSGRACHSGVLAHSRQLVPHPREGGAVWRLVALRMRDAQRARGAGAAQQPDEAQRQLRPIRDGAAIGEGDHRPATRARRAMQPFGLGAVGGGGPAASVARVVANGVSLV